MRRAAGLVSLPLMSFLVFSGCAVKMGIPSKALSGALSLSPAFTVIPNSAQLSFTASGGTGPYVFTKTSSVSGDSFSVTGSSAIYTAPASGSGAITVTVTDAHSNTVTATVGVVTPPKITAGGSANMDQTSGDGSFSCALVSGAVKCWGSNVYGQLGNSSNIDSHVSVSVSGISNAVAVAAGEAHACAVLSDGTVKCWGDNYAGDLGNGATGNASKSNVPVSVIGVSNAISIASEEDSTCVLLSNGTVQCWGDGANGDLGNGTTGSNSGYAVSVSGISTAIAIASGAFHTCALLANGGIECWGVNTSGQFGNGTKTGSSVPVGTSGISNAIAIGAGSEHTCAVLSDGTVQCWGTNNALELGSATWGATKLTPVPVSGVTNAVALAGGAFQVCALLSTGGVQCWGDNNHWQLGNGDQASAASSIPVSVSGISTATAIALPNAEYHACALLSNGGVKCWGYNNTGQLGNNSTTDSSTPVSVQ